jgi:hypothetical protein
MWLGARNSEYESSRVLGGGVPVLIAPLLDVLYSTGTIWETRTGTYTSSVIARHRKSHHFHGRAWTKS